MRRQVLFYAALWIAGALAILFGLGNLYRPLYVRLVAHGVPTQGVIRSIDAKPRNLVKYEYAVGGQIFHDRQYPAEPNPSAEKLQVGQPIMLTYNSQQPSESLLGDPRPKLENENISVVVAAVVMPSFIVFSLIGAIRRKKA